MSLIDNKDDATGVFIGLAFICGIVLGAFLVPFLVQLIGGSL